MARSRWPATVLGDIQQFGSGSTSTGSDHYPVVGDYTLMFPGDFNRDGLDAADILAMEQALTNLPAYQATKRPSNSQLLAIGDINGDGKFNDADLQALINLLQSGGGSTNAVPEPSTFVLAVLAFGLVMLGRWFILLPVADPGCDLHSHASRVARFKTPRN